MESPLQSGQAFPTAHCPKTRILDRLGSIPAFWQDRLEKLRDRSRIFGTVLATKRSEIDRMAEVRGVKKLSNLNGCSG